MTKFSLKAVKLVQRFRYVIPIVWLVLAIIGGYLTPLFVKGTNNALGTPKNTPSQLTEQKIAHFYPDLGSFGGGDSLTLFLWSKQTPPQDIFKQFDLKTFTEQLETKAKQYNQTKDIVVEINGYYVMLEKGFGQDAADAFRSKNNDSTILPISTNKGMHQFYPYLVKIVEEITPANSTLKLGVQIMGTDAFMETIQNSVEIDMARGDGIVVPLAFIILGYMIGSARLLILPLVSLICCGLTSFGLMYFATLSMHVMSTTLSLMMSVTIALTIDYSLFTLTRLREELTQKRGISMEEAVANTLAGAGHTIIVSGLTLFFAFVGLLIIPITTVRSLGTGCAVAVCIILLANVTLVPAILLSFPNFFRRSIEPCAWPCSRAQSNDDDEFDAEAFLEQDQKLTLSGNLEDWMTEDDIKDERNRCGCSWLCVAQKLVKPPFNIISVICVVLFTAPLAYPAVTFTANDSAVLAMPRGAALTDAFQEMNRQFGFGYLNPYTILISSKHPNTTVLSESFWNASHTLINTMSNELYDTPTTGFSGISWASGRDIPLPIVQLCVEMNQAKRQLDVCGALKDEYNRTVSPTNDAAMFTLLLKFDPNSGVGYDWYKQCLLLFKRLNLQQKDWVFDITGGAAPGWDSVTLAYSYFPVMIGVTASIILALVGFALKSVVIPLRSLLGIALTLSFAYGMATVVYQYGWLDWMGFWGLHSYEHEQSILWLPPLVSFSICVGLMLDYDVLLLIRVADYRYSGVPHRLSVIKGVAKTGGIITAAGAIMAVAFSGLLFSNSPAMNQLSFYLVAAVLYDTFVVRTFLIPALMSLTGDVSWWPGIRKGHQPAIKQPKPFSLN